MSAFIVNPTTIDRIVTHIMDNEREFLGVATHSPDFAQQTGEMLYKLNVKSVNSRYRSRDKAPQYTYSRTKASPVQAFKSIRCFLYQSCESDACLNSKAYKALDTLSNDIAANIVARLPEYDQADWG